MKTIQRVARSTSYRGRYRKRQGTIIVLMAFLLPVLLALSAFAVSLAYMESVRIDVQIASDAASRAACRTHAITLSKTAAVSAAQNAVQRNKIAGNSIALAASDVKFGASVRSTTTGKYVFTEQVANVNAVRVNLSTAAGGGLKLPFTFGLAKDRFSNVQTAVASHSDLDIVIVLDRSGSMAFGTDEVAGPLAPPKRAPPGWDFGQPVPPGARWLDAVGAVNVFLSLLSATPQLENVGLASYNITTSFDADMSTDYSSIGPAMNVYSQSYPAGGTAIGDGLFTGYSLVKYSSQARPWAVPVVIVLTDGIWNYGNDPVWAASWGRQSNQIMTYAITFSDEADQALMSRVASEGGGKHFHASTAAELITVFRTIAQDLPILTTE